ncbi:MAG: HDIG domain-containing protein [Armatimonadia bacterium]|nr:HDIG domain-containing protein [Armatimonadia bacterium]
MDRAKAWEIVCEFTESENLRKHALAVEAAMRGYARMKGEDEDLWGTIGLLHDFDWEVHPTLEEHPSKGAEILRERGVDEWIVKAILSHAEHTGVPRETELEKTLFAVDELSGFLVACALVRPSRSLTDIKVKSVKKKMKDKSFAAAVNRDDIRKGAEELGIPLEEHIQNTAGFLADVEDRLGLGAGSSG